MKQLLLIGTLLTLSAFAYTTWDVGTADYLADLGIIQDHRHEVGQYRLEDRISRQEVVGIAIKVNGEVLPDDYVCKWYFSDATFAQSHTDAWVCRSVELAADLGLITRANTRFRPQDSITRAEALAILMSGRGTQYPKNVTIGANSKPIAGLYSLKVPQWQRDLIEWAHSYGIIDAYSDNLTPEQIFGPNVLATRAEIFRYAYNIIENRILDGDDQAPESTTVVNSDSTVTYTSGYEDFRITYPRSFTIQDEEFTSDNETEVAVSFITKNPIIAVQVSRVECQEDECINNTAQIMADIRKNFSENGITIEQELSGNVFLLSLVGSWIDLKQYFKVVFTEDVAYFITATIESEKATTYAPVFIDIFESFSVVGTTI